MDTKETLSSKEMARREKETIDEWIRCLFYLVCLIVLLVSARYLFHWLASDIPPLPKTINVK